MTWWWRRRKHPVDPTGIAEAESALAESRRRLDEAHAQDGGVHSVVRQLRVIRERNGLASMFEAAMRERR